MKKAIRIVSILVLVLTLGYLLVNLGLLLWFSQSGGSIPGGASVGIIGGADGPTAIFITQKPAQALELLLPLLGIILPIAGLVLTRKK